MGDVGAWLDAIAAGRGVGTTSEATAGHHARAGVKYLAIKGAVRIPVSLLWWREDRPPGLPELVEEVADLYGR